MVISSLWVRPAGHREWVCSLYYIKYGYFWEEYFVNFAQEILNGRKKSARFQQKTEPTRNVVASRGSSVW
jgi:hypothetical protein